MNYQQTGAFFLLFFVFNNLGAQVYDTRGVAIAPDFKNRTPFEFRFQDKLFPADAYLASNEFRFVVPVQDDLSVTKVQYSPDGKWILTFSQNLSVKIWEAQSGKLLQTIKLPYKQVKDVCWSPDGQSVFTMSDTWFSNKTETFADIWNVKTGLRRQSFYDSTVKVKMAGFSPDNRYLLLMGTHVLKIVDPVNGALIHTIHSKDELEHAGWANNGSLLYTASNDSVIKVWNSTLKTLITAFKVQGGGVRFAGFTPDAKNLLSLSKDGLLQIWNIAKRELAHQFNTNVANIDWVEYSPSGESVLLKSADNNQLHLLFLSDTIRIIADFRYDRKVTAFSWSGSGKYFTLGQENGLLLTYHATSGKFKSGKLAFQSKVNAVSWSPDEKYWVASSDQNNPQVRLAENSALQKKLEGSVNEINNLAWDERSNITLFTIKKDNPTTDQQLPELNFGSRGGNEYAFNKEVIPAEAFNLSILATNLNYSLFYNFKKDTLKFVLEGTVPGKRDGDYYIYDYQDILFSPDKKFVVTFSDKYKLQLWDLAAARLVCDIVCIDSNDYVFRLPDGFYQASRNGMSKLHYVNKELRVVSFEQLDVKYNRPDKVLQAIGNTDTALIKSYRKAWEKRMKKLGIDTTAFKDGYSVPESDFANRDAIEYEQKNGTVQLHIKGLDSTYKLDRFNIWVNEAPVYGQRGISVRKRNKNDIDTTLVIKLSQGENRIETSITNVNGTESYRMPLIVNYTPAVKHKETTRFIGIGIDQFADNQYNLQYSAKDIRDLSIKLKEKFKDNIIIDTLFNEQVTISTVKALKQKLLQTNENDKVIIAYSGHGMLSKDFDYYLSTYKVNFDKPEQNGLPYEELENLLDSIPARKKLLLIDACHSGEVDKEDLVTLNASSDSLIKGLKPVGYKQDGQLGLKNSFELMQSLFVNVGKSTGATVISAAAGTQFALERNDLKNGVFTFSILEAMNKHATMKISELKKIVGERVEQLTNGLQKPTSRNEAIAVDWNVW